MTFVAHPLPLDFIGTLMLVLVYFIFLYYLAESRIGQSVQRLAKGWMAEESQFESRYGQEFYLLQSVHTGPGAHPASYTVGPGCKAARL
jgi:hypothetical protein